MFDKMKLKPYLLTMFSILIALAGIIALTGIFGLQNTKQNTDLLVNEVLNANSAVKDCRIAANTAGRTLEEMVLLEDSQEIVDLESSINDNLQTIEEQVQIFKDTHGTQDGLALRYETAFQNWRDIVQKAIDEAKSGNWALAKQTVLEECSPALTEMADIAQEIDTVTTQERAQQEQSTLVMLNVYMAVLVTIFVLALVFGFAHIQSSIESFQEKMRGTLSELESSASQVSAGADQVADGAQALAQGATEQASSVEELSAAIDDISNHISDTAEFSQKADRLGQDSREIVNKSKEEMQQLLTSIQEIAQASNHIQSIIKVIDDIAFQTNILALNAAVEAARAGNAGKGFAVVADEVRSLAQKSADAAKETTDMIKNSLRHVSEGEEIAKRTDTAFNGVVTASENILDMIAKIAHASREQADAISQISVGVDQISAVVQTNSATSEQSAASVMAWMKVLVDHFPVIRYDGKETSRFIMETYPITG